MNQEPSNPGDTPLLVIPAQGTQDVGIPPPPPLPKEASATPLMEFMTTQTPPDALLPPREEILLPPSAEEETPTGNSLDNPSWEAPVHNGPTPMSTEEYSFFKIDLLLENIQNHQ